MAAWGQFGGRNRTKASLHPTDSPECCELLIKMGADPNMEDEYGVSPLATACGTGGERCIDMIVEAGAKIDHVNKDGATALHECFYRGNTPCLSKLLKHKPNTSLRARTGKTPFECIFIDNMFEMLYDVLNEQDILDLIAGDPYMSVTSENAEQMMS